MKINYGIHRRSDKPGARRRLEHRNHQLEMDGDWNRQTFHGQIKQRIHRKHPGWSITGYAIAPEELREIHVWAEGFRTTGEQGYATYHGHCRAVSFRDACDYLFKDHSDYDAAHATLWACRLFDNETDARKAFG